MSCHTCAEYTEGETPEELYSTSGNLGPLTHPNRPTLSFIVLKSLERLLKKWIKKTTLKTFH